MDECGSVLYIFSPPNGPELSSAKRRGDGSQSARGMSSPIVADCCVRAKSSTAISVSLSDWLGGTRSKLIITRISFFDDFSYHQLAFQQSFCFL